ncbi:hypothetical protein Tco_0617076 [Tanacetum coccineum]
MVLWASRSNMLEVCRSLSSGDQSIKSFEEKKIWLHQWFDNIKFLNNNSGSYGMLVWLNIKGLPPLERDINLVKAIAKEFGRTLEVERLDFDSKLLLPVKAHLPNMNVVNESLIGLLNGIYYHLRIFEEQLQASNLLSLHSSDIKDDFVCEEEFIGPSMDRNDYDSVFF